MHSPIHAYAVSEFPWLLHMGNMKLSGEIHQKIIVHRPSIMFPFNLWLR